MKKILRIIGALIVSIIAAIYLFIIIGALFDGEKIPFTFEALGMTIMSLLTVVSAVLDWVKVKVGVWATLTTGVLFSIFGLITAGQNKWMALVAAGGPVLLGGMLILLGGYNKK